MRRCVRLPKAKANAKKIGNIADRQDTTQRSALTRQKEKARARNSKESVATAARKGIPQGNARKVRKEESQKEKEMENVLKGNRFEILAAESDQVFRRRA